MTENTPDRTQRIQLLKTIITELHDGASPDAVRKKLTELVRRTDASEIADMEQELMDDGMPVENIQAMCDLHSQVMRDVLTERLEQGGMTPGHPVDVFKRENTALAAANLRMRIAMAKCLKAEDDATRSQALAEFQSAFNDICDVDTHYLRKENLLFPFMEKHGIGGPSKVMWGKHDETRAMIKKMSAALKDNTAAFSGLATAFEETGKPLAAAIDEMIYKEENILLPLAVQNLTDAEWGAIHNQTPEYGWCLIDPPQDYTPTVDDHVSAPDATPLDGKKVMFPSGSLSAEQLLAMFSVLPVDITFVDEHDKVRFFTEGPDRVFARSRAIIGRTVQHCHPPSSVHIVEKIIDDFRAGREQAAEFWITYQERFVHIRYFAMRYPDGQYAGVLEMTQDVTSIRKLEGERRLLTYDE